MTLEEPSDEGSGAGARPAAGTVFGSDRAVATIAELGIDFMSLNPGATIRGLHDSVVNRPDGKPELILAMHEEIAVAIAHGYAKAAGRPMAVALHDTVGLLHATMALFNAWVDRVPILAVVGTGPMDTQVRRPWIDWVHTVGEQGDLVRHFTKWNDQPASVAGIVSSLRRAWRTALTQPMGPVIVGLDALLQEEEVDPDVGGPLHPDQLRVSRFAPDPALIETALERLHAARRPVIVTDRPLTAGAAAAVVRLAELTGSALVEVGAGGTFPVGHPHDVTDEAREALGRADLLLFVDVRDPARALGTIDLRSRRMSGEGSGVSAISIGLSDATDRSWMVTESDVPPRLGIIGDPELAVVALCDGWGATKRALPDEMASLAGVKEVETEADESWLDRGALASEVARGVAAHDVVLGNSGVLRGSHTRRAFRFQRSDQFLGQSGGEGLGYGAPASVGAALAHRGSDRLVLDLQGDGDLMYVPQSLWTAAHHRIPLLMVVDANRSYLQDRHHQLAMASQRGRSSQNVGLGIDMVGPEVRFAALARSLGVHGIGPVATRGDLRAALGEAVPRVLAGEPVLVEAETRAR
ncbi:MAG TPA: thiamine pyrophosphate-dependent enzyme [Candidatus Limnocylindria bacterium]|nr:thiamine pyrophosphate-dependent enzyme [Candidatus Limnocylindria bacterium]